MSTPEQLIDTYSFLSFFYFSFISRSGSLFCAAETECGCTEFRITEVTEKSRHLFAEAIRPTAAADTFVETLIWSLGILFRHKGVVVHVVPVIGPLHHVSNHVVETIAIRRKRSDIHGVPCAESSRRPTASASTATGRAVAPGIRLPIQSATRCLLPFGFGGKPFTGPLAVGIRLEPVDVIHRLLLFTARDLAVTPVPRGLTALRFEEASVIGICDLVLVDVKGIQIDMVRGPIIHFRPRNHIDGVSPKSLGTAHPELTGRNLCHSFRHALRRAR